MPLYEYECESCGARFEVIQRFSDNPVEACRQCGGPVHKLLSPPAIQFKGTGWYITDYARKNSSGPTHTSSSPTSSGSTAAKTDPSASSSGGSSPAGTNGSAKKD